MKKLRLAGVASYEAANRFLEEGSLCAPAKAACWSGRTKRENERRVPRSQPGLPADRPQTNPKPPLEAKLQADAHPSCELLKHQPAGDTSNVV